MEIDILHTVGFDIGYPLSYRFLRRYSKCASAPTPVLTLARYLLESSLLDYAYVSERDSRMAAACMLLALHLTKTGEWVSGVHYHGNAIFIKLRFSQNPTMVHYTGYRAAELMGLVRKLNNILSATPNKHLKTIRTKYSHP